ncbi:hypothetical protein [Verrucosispora sp. NA02020]|uniref:hypothetical protein n=1 Tax=Verrucosispora sp. NA02020 TaxID=2742132 RepID=UPI001590A4C0|nr:hypothetical protein [Verrucosispora sp. NA02020]QKW15363.1 hypothetical protein HUT12_23095 [Verrucosispora sp. NA02020]
MTGWIERGWTDRDGNNWITTADGARCLGPSRFRYQEHGVTMPIRRRVNNLRQRLANCIAPTRTYEVVMNEGQAGGVPLARVVSRNGAGDVYTIREVYSPKRPFWLRRRR